MKKDEIKIYSEKNVNRTASLPTKMHSNHSPLDDMPRSFTQDYTPTLSLALGPSFSLAYKVMGTCS